ncbi:MULTISPECIES: hypothetical protein [unclassified Candidatus Tisiphia]|uniref:hypothetical protein n=1 Tax=unclassified Candidatus Tisiphia TaxID=2996318 RepID=UPI00312CB716
MIRLSKASSEVRKEELKDLEEEHEKVRGASIKNNKKRADDLKNLQDEHARLRQEFKKKEDEIKKEMQALKYMTGDALALQALRKTKVPLNKKANVPGVRRQPVNQQNLSVKAANQELAKTHNEMKKIQGSSTPLNSNNNSSVTSRSNRSISISSVGSVGSVGDLTSSPTNQVVETNISGEKQNKTQLVTTTPVQVISRETVVGATPKVIKEEDGLSTKTKSTISVKKPVVPTKTITPYKKAS